MRNKLMMAVATAISLSAVATTAVSAPLPAGTKLTITPWVNPAMPLLDNGVGCPFGSCFGMGVIAGFFSWTALEPGTDGGFIIGKAQRGGGQEADLTSTLPGELTAMWDFGGNHGTFHTSPSDAGNVFNDASCTGSACGSNTIPRLTNLAVWNTAWGGLTIPMGAAAGCDKVKLSNCTADMVAGIFVNSWTIDPAGTNPRNYELRYSQVVPSVFANFPYRLILKGTVEGKVNNPPVVTVNGSAAAASLSTTSGTPVTFTIAVTDPDGPAAATCRAVFSGPANGAVTLNGCTSGTYTSDGGFVGSNSFNVLANDSLADSIPAAGGTVNVAVAPLPPSPTPLISPTPTALISPTPTALISPTPTALISPTPTALISPTPTALISPTPTALISPTPVPPGSPTPVISPTPTALISPTPTTKISPTPTTVISPTPTAMISPTPTPTNPASPTACTDKYPTSQVTLVGKQGHLTVVVTGNITKVSSSGKEIKICPSTKASYTATTNTAGASVTCKVKSHVSKGKGGLKVNDEVKCSDRPVGNDKVKFKVKSGEYKKASND